jgi:GntR family transcriptional regulator
LTDVQDIVDKFIFDIRSGVYEPDDKLPSENEIKDLYRVPRITARRAYETLQELGYIYSMQGKGSFVKNRQQQIPLLLSGNLSFSKKMLELGFDYESRNIGCEEIQYNKRIYQELEAAEQDKVFRIARLRLVDQRPIALHTSYLAERIFVDIATVGKTITSIFDYYKSVGYTDYVSKTTVLSIAFPSKQERELLQCSSLIPLLVLESGCIDQQSGAVLEFTRTLYRSDLFTYVI